MRIIPIQSTVSPGHYPARFVGVKDSRPHPRYGPGLRFWFEIVGGNFSGQKVARTTPPTSIVGNSTERFLTGLAGRPLSADDNADVDEFIGSLYVIEVVLDYKGRPLVNS